MDDGKTCFKCSQTKPRSEFYRHPKMADGLLGKCKECTKADVARRPKELTRAYDKARSQTPKRRAQMQAKWRRELLVSTEKVRARKQLSNAVRRGAVKRKPCEQCGSSDGLQAHHDDYSRPLDVRWLCRECHIVEHHPRRQAPF